MKSLFLFFFILFTQTCMGMPVIEYACMDLKISIKNSTNNTCYLLTEDLASGIIHPEHDVVLKIPAGATSSLMQIKQSDVTIGTGLELVYECGIGSYIRLYTNKNECGSQNKVYTKVLYKENLSATVVSNPASYWSNQAASVQWTIQ